MSDVRLIERWLPIAEIGEESIRERRSMTARYLPSTISTCGGRAGRWWPHGRRSLHRCCLRTLTDRSSYTCLGIHGDPVVAKKRIAMSPTARVSRLGDNPYGYSRAFGLYAKAIQIALNRTWLAEHWLDECHGSRSDRRRW